WGHPQLVALEEQLLAPLFGDQPEELANKSAGELEARLTREPRYTELFRAAYPDEEQPIVLHNVQRALAAFQRTLISGDSAFDRFQRGDEGALSASAQRGMRLVTTGEDARFKCHRCHGTIFFTDHATWEGRAQQAQPYHQTGLYNLDGNGAYPVPNTGTHEVSGHVEDMGMFKAPTLRNIALTAPYMHDGSIGTLSAVLDHYAQGGRENVAGRTDPLLVPFSLTDGERADILAFLESLTDHAFVTDARFADPWR
ncbi:MAG TPA: cytochrome c peroxidase, partial [Polyangiales bacterium]